MPGGWLFAGSIVDLTPDAEYEVRLDPPRPGRRRRGAPASARTAAEPREPPGMRVRHVAPGEGGGSGVGERALPGARRGGGRGGARRSLPAPRRRLSRRALARAAAGRAGRPIIYRRRGRRRRHSRRRGRRAGGERAGGAPRLAGGRHSAGRALSLSWGTGGATSSCGAALRGDAGGIRGDQRRLYRVARLLHHRQYLRGPVAVAAFRAASSPSTPSRSRAPGTRSRGTTSLEWRTASTAPGTGGCPRATSTTTTSSAAPTTASRPTTRDTNVRVLPQSHHQLLRGSERPAGARRPALRLPQCRRLNIEYSPVKLHNDTGGVLIFHNRRSERAYPSSSIPAARR